MDLATPNKEVIQNAEGSHDAVIESTPIAETVAPVPTTPVQTPTTVSSSSAAKDPEILHDVQNDNKITADEVADLTSTDVEGVDENWVGKVREVIKDDEGLPYKEEEDAESLNEEYMKNRFNVDVDAPIEEK